MNLILFTQQADSYFLERNDLRFRHIRTVLRAETGDTVRVGVVNGPLGSGRIERLDDRGVSVSVEWRAPATPSAPVTLLLGHPRPPVLKRLWRDLATIGVREICVFTGELGERSYLTSSAWNDPESWLRDGLSQGGHTTLPRLTRCVSLTDALDRIPPAESEREQRFVGVPGSVTDLSLQRMLDETCATESVFLCVGPERGLTPVEDEALRITGFRPVSLGNRVLRTETAAILLTGAVCSVYSSPTSLDPAAGTS